MIRLPALVRIASVILVSTGVSATAWGQGTGAPQLPQLKRINEFKHGGDAYMRVTFSSLGTRTVVQPNDSGEVMTDTQGHGWHVAGMLEVKTLAPAVGRRVFQVMGVVGELRGSFTETRNKTQRGIYGEGGLQNLKEEWVESWIAPHVAFAKFPGVTSISVYLDTRTWLAPELAETFDQFASGLQKAESYSGRWTPMRKTDVIYNSISSNKRQPPPGCLGDSPLRVSKFSAEQIGLVTKMMEPLPLPAASPSKDKGAPDKLAGTAVAAVTFPKQGAVSGAISWEIIRELPELELRVTAPKLKKWLPEVVRKSSTAFDPGPAIELTAEVIDPAGGSTKALRIRRMRWWLEDTSRLPGAAMNWPYASTNFSPDLTIEHPSATDEGQSVEFTELINLRKSIRIRPWDHGAWGTLRVEAELDDGRTLQGKIVGQEGGDPTAIRLPAREPDSKIASYWKDLWANGEADNADVDDFGAGKSKGDGFTVFEEYRGFYVNGKFEWGWPALKEVFVYDRIRDTSTRKAVAHFQAASRTGTFVIELGSQELDDSRVVNRNRGNGPTRGNQHAIGLRRAERGSIPSFEGMRPGQAEVEIPSEAAFRAYATNLNSRSELFPRAIAQAMLKACRVPKPGEGDSMVPFAAKRGPGGAPVVACRFGFVSVREEVTGRDLGEVWLAEFERDLAIVRARSGGRSGDDAAEAVVTRKYYVAMRGGEHSGPVGNIMRDAFADAYLQEDTKTVIMLSPSIPEKIGYTLTKNSAGDHYNATGDARLPLRYGSSTRPAAEPTFDVKDSAP